MDAILGTGILYIDGYGSPGRGREDCLVALEQVWAITTTDRKIKIKP